MYEIIINTSVGPFKLGHNVKEYLSDYSFEYVPKQSELEDWDSYRYNEGTISLYTNRGVIESIACRTDCYLEEYFIVGSNVDNFFMNFDIDKSTLEKDEIFLDDDVCQEVYEVDTLGLQIWVSYDNKIETVFVS